MNIFAGVKWKCLACGEPVGCGCWVKCECGRTVLRGKECDNAMWHLAKQFAEDAADKIVEDMAESYKIFQRAYMAARLKRAVVRQAQPIILATFDGVESVLAEKKNG